MVVYSYERGYRYAQGVSASPQGVKEKDGSLPLLLHPLRERSERHPLHRYAVNDISLTSMKASRRGFQFRSAATP
jgi:hypothetical protein